MKEEENAPVCNLSCMCLQSAMPAMSASSGTSFARWAWLAGLLSELACALLLLLFVYVALPNTAVPRIGLLAPLDALATRLHIRPAAYRARTPIAPNSLAEGDSRVQPRESIDRTEPLPRHSHYAALSAVEH